jgi:uncharacterized membrane protein YbhN (UPF0104 family)
MAVTSTATATTAPPTVPSTTAAVATTTAPATTTATATTPATTTATAPATPTATTSTQTTSSAGATGAGGTSTGPSHPPISHPAVHVHHSTSIGNTIHDLLHSASQFFSQLANLAWAPLAIGLVLYALYLLLRSRALFNAVGAAYPGEKIRWRDVWGGYMVGYAVNNVFPLGGGNIAQLFLTRNSIPPASYPTIATALSTGVIFDWFIGLLVMAYSFTQGVFPKPPDFSKIPAFDISFFAGNMRFTLFLLTALSVGFLVAFALLSARVKAFWIHIRQGIAILRDRRMYRRRMASWQFASWIARFASYWALLDAFHIGGSVRNALLVLGVQVVASVFPFTPGGIGVQQAILLEVFKHSQDAASFAVGQQIATAILSTALGFAALVLIFRFRSFREVMQRGRADRRAEGSRETEQDTAIQT